MALLSSKTFPAWNVSNVGREFIQMKWLQESKNLSSLQNISCLRFPSSTIERLPDVWHFLATMIMPKDVWPAFRRSVTVERTPTKRSRVGESHRAQNRFAFSACGNACPPFPVMYDVSRGCRCIRYPRRCSSFFDLESILMLHRSLCLALSFLSLVAGCAQKQPDASNATDNALHTGASGASPLQCDLAKGNPLFRDGQNVLIEGVSCRGY